MTQVATRDTVDVGEALDRIEDAPFCVRIGTSNGVAFIRDCTEGDRLDEDYHVNVYVPVVEERRVIREVDGGTVTEAIKNAETAKIVPVEESPWSRNWDETDELEPVPQEETEA